MEYLSQDDEQNSNEHQSDFGDVNTSLLNPDLIPKSGMIFKSEDELYNFYLEYARRVGFGITKNGYANNLYGQKRYFTVVCSRAGKRQSKSVSSSTSQKMGCKAKINAVVSDEGVFTLTKINLEHNHDLSPTKARYFRCNKKMDEYVKKRLELNDQAGIRVCNNFHSLAVEAGGYENMSFTQKDCRNHIDKVRQLRLGGGDSTSLSMYFADMQRMNPNFFYMIQLDYDGRLSNVFWADARSIAAYESFGDVISFDTTYLTNKYDMPFAPFVGVNHHGQSILFGCGLLSNEEAETYMWLFRAWLKCMSKAPRAIITDQCKSIQKAVNTVFPDSHYRLCLWHIMKKLPEKLSKIKDYEQIQKVLREAVYESIDVEEFENNWGKMIQDFDLSSNKWLSDLYEDRYRWVPAFVKGVFWAGMSTTQRSESMNSFFDGYVNSKTSLRQFVEQYDNAMRSKIEKEKQADFSSSNSNFSMITGFPFEQELQDVYTHEVFRWCQDELLGLVRCNLVLLNWHGTVSTFTVNDTLRSGDGLLRKKVAYIVSCDEANLEVKCSCRLFEFKGIICRHMMKVFIEKNIMSIPSQYILHRWRKDVKHKHLYIKNCYNDKSDECRMRNINMYSECCKAMEIGEQSEEFYQAAMRSMEETTAKLTKMSLKFEKQSTEASSMIMPEDYQLNPHFTSPVKMRGKGRPPTKRRISIREQKGKKKKNALSQEKGKTSLIGTQESEFGTQESTFYVDNDVEEDSENEIVLCGVCGYNYDEFWICCDNCGTWFHGRCVQISEARAVHMKTFKCTDCRNNRGKEK